MQWKIFDDQGTNFFLCLVFKFSKIFDQFYQIQEDIYFYQCSKNTILDNDATKECLFFLQKPCQQACSASSYLL